MVAAASVALSSDGLSLKISGILDVDTVPQLANKADQFISDVVHPIFDLEGVVKAESSALALLTAWRRQAHVLGKTAHFVHVPKYLMDIAKLSNVENILGLSEESRETL